MIAVELVLILLAASAALELLARRIGIPHPVLLVLGGLLVALAPGLPPVRLDPDVVFLVFVPPLLYWAALTSSYRELRRNLRSISLLAVILVLVTACAVAAVAHAVVPGMGWAPAFVLGAIVSPTDAVAATTVARRLGVPRNAVTILEGEGLVNDATALVAYRVAVGAVAAGSFSLGSAAASWLVAAGGGVAIGLGIGWAIAWMRSRLDHPVVENTISLLTPFVAYLPAEAVGTSGVLAVVTVGLYLGRRAPRIVSPRTRVQAGAMWEMVAFLLEGLIFVLIGRAAEGAASGAAAVVGRSAGAGGHHQRHGHRRAAPVDVPRCVSLATHRAALREQRGVAAWRGILLVAWAGMRGGVSLVIALAIPLTIAGGKPFPDRDRIIFFTFAVILATLVLQGLSLAPMIRFLKLKRDDGRDVEERKARHKVAAAGLRHLDELEGEGDDELVKRLRRRHAHRVHRYGPSKEDSTAAADHDDDQLAADYRRIRGAMIAAEREELIRLRDENVIEDDVMRQIQRELDLEQMLLDSPRPDPVGEVAERG